jgi:hypothetical protein
VNPRIRAIADLDRVVHEPGRLMIVALLSDAGRKAFQQCRRKPKEAL